MMVQIDKTKNINLLKQNLTLYEHVNRHACPICFSLSGSFVTGVVVAGIIMIVNIWKLYSSHRRHIRKLLLGNNKFIPEKCWNIRPQFILVRIRYTYEGFSSSIGCYNNLFGVCNFSYANIRLP